MNSIGATFLIFGITACGIAFYENNHYQVFWLCYIGLILLGIGFLARNAVLIASQINVLLTVHIIWIIDFIFYLINGYTLFGIVDYFFVGSYFTIPKIISLQHIFAMPFAFYSLSILKLNRKDVWKISVIQIIFLATIIRIMTPAEQNINCFFNPCVELDIGLPYYLVLTISYLAVILLTNSILVRLFYKKK